MLHTVAMLFHNHADFGTIWVMKLKHMNTYNSSCMNRALVEILLHLGVFCVWNMPFKHQYSYIRLCLTHWGRNKWTPFRRRHFQAYFFMKMLGFRLKISLKFVPKGPINNNPALVQMMAWPWQGDKPLSDPMMGLLPTHICVTRPQCVNSSPPSAAYMHQWTRSSLVQVMICRLFSAKPLPDPMLPSCQLHP